MTLRGSAVKGVFWTSFGTIGSGIVNLILTMIMARLLSPFDFGLLELLVIFSIISESFIDSGFSQAVIRDNNATDTDLSSVLFFNVFLAITLYSLLFCFAPLIADFFNEERLVSLARFVFLTLIFNSLSIVQNANLSRQLNFKLQAIASITSIVISAIISICLAYFHYGVWALATNLVSFSFFKMIMLWILSSWRPLFIFSIESIKKYFRFGGFLLIKGLIDTTVTNLESLFIGRIYTKQSLGYYSQARKLDTYLMNFASVIIQKVTYPILAKIKEDKKKLKDGYRSILGITMVFIVPLSLFSICSSENLVIVFLGEKWILSAPYLQLRMLIALIVSFYSIFTNIFLVLGKSKNLLYLSLLRQCAKIVIIIFLIKISIMSLLWGILIVTIITGLIYVYFGGKLIRYSLFEIIIDLRKIILSGCISATIVYILGKILIEYDTMLVFVLQCIVMPTLYWIILVLFKDKTYTELIKIFKSFNRKA